MVQSLRYNFLTMKITELIQTEISSIYFNLTSRSIKYFAVFSFLFIFRGLTYAQVNARFYSEEEQQALADYTIMKENLPAYFKDYARGGFYRFKDPEEIIELNAIKNFVPMPVIIASAELDAYALWRKNLGYTPDKNNKNASPLSMSETEKQNIILEKERQKALKDAQALLKDKQPSNREEKEAYTRLSQGGTDPKDIEIVKNIGKSKPTETKKANTNKESKKEKDNKQFIPYNPITPELQAKIDQMGGDAGYKWLFNQQVLAGNVIFCDEKTLEPLAVYESSKGLDNDEINRYKNLIQFLIKAYPSIFEEAAEGTPLHQLKNNEQYINQSAKMSVTKGQQPFSVSEKIWMKMKNEAAEAANKTN